MEIDVVRLGSKNNMAQYHLHKWSVQTETNPYIAPEMRSIQLVGFRDNETKRVVTSPVVKIDGKTITTRSGSVYLLQDISTEYLAWMMEQGIPYEVENPIKVKRK